jgi:hypothetical protein
VYAWRLFCLWRSGSTSGERAGAATLWVIRSASMYINAIWQFANSGKPRMSPIRFLAKTTLSICLLDSSGGVSRRWDFPFSDGTSRAPADPSTRATRRSGQVYDAAYDFGLYFEQVCGTFPYITNLS